MKLGQLEFGSRRIANEIAASPGDQVSGEIAPNPMAWIGLAMVAIGAISLCAGIALATGEVCLPLSKTTAARAAAIIAKANGVRGQLVLTGLEPNGQSCFQRASFRDENGRAFAATISPDSKFVLSGIIPIPAGVAVATSLTAGGGDAFRQLPPASVLEAERGAPFRGVATAPVHIVEFSDFQCPFCRQLETSISAFQSAHPGAAVVYFRQFPLPNHPWALQAARMSDCALAQGQPAFWALHDGLYRQQSEITVENAYDHALGVLRETQPFEKTAFAACVGGEDVTNRVNADRALGQRLGVRVTPTIFVNGRPMEGALSEQQVEVAVASASTAAAH